MFEPSTMYASLLWGAVGSGFLIYGKQRAHAAAIIGGLALLAVTFVAGSASTIWMAGIVVCTAVWGISRYSR